ncbi:hypothetical protein BDW68DRAFT_154755 [Aspergillus falconensis]
MPHEVQEQEITQEVQREQQVCRPPPVDSVEHDVHDLRHFVKHGQLPAIYDTDAVRPAFKSLSRTSAGQFNIPLGNLALRHS